MDLLKRELQRKRKALEDDFGGRKLLRRSEIEHKETERLRQLEKLHRQPKSLNAAASSPPPSSSPSKMPNDPLPRGAVDNWSAARDEVIRRLRILKHPATLFGEDDAGRLRRLQTVIESGPIETEEELADGQTNDFLRDIHNLRREQKAGTAVAKREGGTGTAEKSPDTDTDSIMAKGNFEDLCDEDKIQIFFTRLLGDWGQEVAEMPDAEKRTAKGKSAVATFNQCDRYLNPMFKLCRKKALPGDIRQALVRVAQCCQRRDYLAATDEYIKLAIGNAPWPIGVTMVGIHERSAREKICANSIAHVMNNETTRKYLQSVKRLMTFCQRRYPTDPSRSSEFNSLANGSDLQSLLAENRSSSAKNMAAKERPTLVSAA
ncbi:pre-mRNA-splicing factor 18-like [Zingiber officinale]|uniref:Pre-mRNA-splicing factor 18 n=1 Tax=Zingiber officinale TaxID=94328 RepID=A0A8J5GVV2_ZINOF|nr:pre-mRNA-splicing factor 18-like [Zingiber officinale]KAG6510886.1 hypothetical protein ZIOFF_028931 [Zingiber officinale]